MGSALTTYRPTSVSTTTTHAGGGGGSDLLDEYIRKRLAAQERKEIPSRKVGFGVRAAVGRPSTIIPRGQRGEGGVPERVETPWYSSQGAATVPVGLQPGAIPGMGIDPRKLPPEMRASGMTLSDGSDVEAANALRARNQAVFDDMMRMSRERGLPADPYGGGWVELHGSATTLPRNYR